MVCNSRFWFKFILALSAAWFYHTNLLSQVDSTSNQISTGVDPIGTASPSTLGSRKSKGLSLTYNLITKYSIDSNSKLQGVPDSEATVRRLNEFKLKINAPVIIKPDKKLIIGIRYQLEEYNFKTPAGLDNDINTNLEDKNLHALGINVNWLKSIDDRNFYILRVGAALNGDYSGGEFPITRYVKAQLSALYGWKYNPNSSLGLGLSFNYTLGRPAIYPVVLWNRTFNPGWGFESLLPARFFLRHNISERTIILGGYEVQGDSYHITIDSPPLSDFPALELRRSDIMPKIIFEQEIYDFLWFGLEAGYRININFDVAQDNSFDNRAVLENEVSSSGFFNVSLFVVPPKKLSSKFLKEGLQ